MAELGKGAYLNGQPIHVSDMSEMEKALVIVGTSPYEGDGRRTGCSTLVKRIFQRSADIRRAGQRGAGPVLGGLRTGRLLLWSIT